MIVSIKCSFGDRPEKHYALFDTGARWSVIPQSIAESYPDCFFSLDTEISQVSRHGKNTGVLHLCNIRFLADDGEDIIFESNVLVIPDWNGPIVIGFTAMLDKIRWACDPTIDHQGRLYFGID
ncbi:MAG: hypothetical protein OEL83_05055 [Desulforhopalus sp.]|nr:hypothetical protein [Desulforhopalus sp.]